MKILLWTDGDGGSDGGVVGIFVGSVVGLVVGDRPISETNTKNNSLDYNLIRVIGKVVISRLLWTDGDVGSVVGLVVGDRPISEVLISGLNQ